MPRKKKLMTDAVASAELSVQAATPSQSVDKPLRDKHATAHAPAKPNSSKAAVAPAKGGIAKVGACKGGAGASASESASMLAVLEQAVAAEEARRAKSLDKMRGFEAAEEARRQKKLTKERVKAVERQALLSTVREQKRAAKAAKAKAKAKARVPATPAAGKPRKRVTFSPQLEV